MSSEGVKLACIVSLKMFIRNHSSRQTFVENELNAKVYIKVPTI